MWVVRFIALALFLGLTACGGKSIQRIGGEAGAGSECDETTCGDECVDTSNDPGHCGGCFRNCGAGESCSGGVCQSRPGCAPPTTQCGGECVDLRFSQDHCGFCNNPCGFGSVCTNGQCLTRCPSGQCGDQCVDFGSDPNNCGACGNRCIPGYFCSGGQCLDSCMGGLVCDGVCVDPLTDPYHCGGCFYPCLGPDVACLGGVCQSVCPPNTLYCRGTCVDWTSDPTNCGGCGIRCGMNQQCANGMCFDPCPTGTWCDGQCTDLSSDPNNCGICFAQCSMGNRCVNGMCTMGTCGDGALQSGEEADPPPGPLSVVPLDPRTCRYDFSRINQWYCYGTCGNWGGPNECDQLDADAFCRLKMDNPRSTAVSFQIVTARAEPGVCCPPPTHDPGTNGCTSVGVLSSRGVNLAVSVHPTNLFSTHSGGQVVTNLVCTDPPL